MGRSGATTSKAASRDTSAAVTALFDSTELRVQHTEQLRQVSDGILELTQANGESTEFALGHAPSSIVSPSPTKTTRSRQQPAASTSAKGDRSGRPSSSTATAASVALSSSTLAHPSKRKQPKSKLSSAVERSDRVEASGTTVALKENEDEGPEYRSSPAVVKDKDDGEADISQGSNLPSNPRKEASRGGVAVVSNTSDNDDALAGGALLLPPGAYSVRPGVSTSVLDESESKSSESNDDDLDAVPPSGTRSVDSSSSMAARSAETAMATPTVTATAVTRDDLEQEVRERILREAVVAEVMVAAVASSEPTPNAAASSLAPQIQPSQPASVPDGFFTSSKPSVPDGFFTNPNDSTVSFSLPEAPLDHDADKRNSRREGCCATCAPCCYTWRWWLLGLVVLLLIMGAMGVVFGVVLPSQNSDESKKKGNNQLGSTNDNGGLNNLRRTSAPSPQVVPTSAPSVSSLTQEPTVGSDTSTTPQPAPATNATSAPVPIGTPATPNPAPAPTSAVPWTASTLLQFLKDNTVDGGMGLNLDGTPAKDAYDAIVASSAFAGVPLNGLMVDVFTLMCLYLLTNGASTWLNHQGWGENPNACEWYGVTCNADGRVARLFLPSNGIRGGLSLDINNIQDQLTYLDVSGNQLFFDRSNLSGLYRLQHLNVSLGGVSVNIDVLLGSGTAFPSLQVLDVSSNSMNGPIPTSIGTMTQLRRLLLQHNQFTGSIPTELAQLTNLASAKFEGNGFTGLMPDGLCQLQVSSGTSLLPKLSADCDVSCSCCTPCS